MRARQAFEAARRRLEAAGVEDAAFDAAALVAAQAGEGWRWQDPALDESALARLEELTARRAAREPLQYILGRWPFLDFELAVGPGVLCPRADTELLVEEGAKRLAGRSSPAVLDLCAGSGCVGLAVAANVPACRVVLGELSEGALRTCKQNVRRNGLNARVTCVQADALEPPDAALWDFDVIACNPPYIPTADIETLDPSVRDHEPHLALDGGADGLDFYRVIADKWRDALLPNGLMAFEVGIGQADEVLRIMRANGFGDIQIVKDLHGIPRVVYGRLCKEI